ncbi:AAA family ATPase [Vibrio lentus]|uniref:AAA family ATPase n=1 Tax=Vibrio lentus TaxID=136468 RepID=UPI000C81993B|nr:AAA family ATPase [Vibrio lentus]PMN35851.1 hypothetical protein BCT33_09435 [Vibrio lentus]PMN58300.1 hypothetical protein BCT29_05870 [Vibrio lentus]
MKWKLNKLEISGFKVFEKFYGDFNSDFVVFDGPNGFGKTSIYDALQLLFCGEIPRIKALSKVINKGKATKQYKRNLYWNNNSENEVTIKAELSNGVDTLFILREASIKDLKTKKYNKPTEFGIFKLFQIDSFDGYSTKTLIEKHEEEVFFSSKFGEYFVKNFSLLNYMSQDSNAIIVPDHSNEHKARFDQISHLINLEEVDNKIKTSDSLKRANELKLSEIKKRIASHIEQVKSLEEKVGEENNKVEYKKLSSTESLPQWDKKKPFVNVNEDDFNRQIDQVALLRNIVSNKDEVRLRVKNKLILDFVNNPEFSIAVLVSDNFKNYESMSIVNSEIEKLKKQINVLSIGSVKIIPEHLDNLKSVNKEDIKSIKDEIEIRDKIQKNTDGYISELTKLNQLRDSIIEKLNYFSDKTECPLCGFDYEERLLLEEALISKTERIEKYIDENDNAFKLSLKSIKDKIDLVNKNLSKLHSDKTKSFDSDLFKYLSDNINKRETVGKIVNRFKKLGFRLNENYEKDKVKQDILIEDIKNKVLFLRKPETDVLLNGSLTFLNNNFKDIEVIYDLNENDVKEKECYLRFKYNEVLNGELDSKKKELGSDNKKIEILLALKEKLSDYSLSTVYVKNTYSSRTLGQIESLFHIYSGRLIQNYQRGLGLFIDTDEEKTEIKSKSLSFFTADGTEYDAVLSMSSGQISALTLSFFLSLNRKYAKTAFIFIDDPTQCMDEINIASLSDLLRVELKDRQVVISTHEQEVSDYLRYRYIRGGLNAKSIHLQKEYSSRSEI